MNKRRNVRFLIETFLRFISIIISSAIGFNLLVAISNENYLVAVAWAIPLVGILCFWIFWYSHSAKLDLKDEERENKAALIPIVKLLEKDLAKRVQEACGTNAETVIDVTDYHMQDTKLIISVNASFTNDSGLVMKQLKCVYNHVNEGYQFERTE